MKKNEWNDGLNHIDSDLVNEFIVESEKIEKKKKINRLFLRFGAIAVCFFLIIGTIAAIPLFDSKTCPIINMQIPFSSPNYLGSELGTVKINNGITETYNTYGISVTAKLIETLPDTYTFFDDWNQYEFRILRMKVTKLLKGAEMTDEFYYMIPVDFMTNFSVFHKFVIFDMEQYGYEYSIVYNKTKNLAERLELVLFGYNGISHHQMGESLMAFNCFGIFDTRLWKSNDKWIKTTERSTKISTIWQAEKKARQDALGHDLSVGSLKNISGNAADVLKSVTSFENGVYVPVYGAYRLSGSPKVSFHAFRYVNGFPTNEKVTVYSKDFRNSDTDIFHFTKARFNEEDIRTLPNLTSAFSSVTEAYNKGEITPPHIENYSKLHLMSYGIFGWYAKAHTGVIGIVRVSWHYIDDTKEYLDDMYYIVESGSGEFKRIDRDELLEKFGDYETTYIYEGKYNENGKCGVLSFF